MARHHDRDGIGSDGLTDRTRHVGLADVPRDLTVRGDVPVLDVEQPAIYVMLEARRRSCEVEREIERLPLFGEISLELVHGLPEVVGPGVLRVGMVFARQSAEFDAADPRRRHPDGDRARASVREVCRVDLDPSQCGPSDACFFKASWRASKPINAHLMRTGNLLTP